MGALLALVGVAACATATNSDAIDDTETSAGADSAGQSPGVGGSDAPSKGGASSKGGAPSSAGAVSHAGATSNGVAGRSASGGSSSVAGASGASLGGHSGTSSGGAKGSAGAPGAAGSTATAGAGGALGTGPCAMPMAVSGGKTNNLGTTGAVCLRTSETFNTIGCSNWGGRTIKVNGVLATCNVKTTFAPAIDGFNYFEISAGDVDFAALVWYTS